MPRAARHAPGLTPPVPGPTGRWPPAGQPAARLSDSQAEPAIWILGTPISSVDSSISNVTFDIEHFDIECSFDIDVFNIRYRISISKVFDIECHLPRYRR
jgi:hypothetical protein